MGPVAVGSACRSPGRWLRSGQSCRRSRCSWPGSGPRCRRHRWLGPGRCGRYRSGPNEGCGLVHDANGAPSRLHSNDRSPGGLTLSVPLNVNVALALLLRFGGFQSIVVSGGVMSENRPTITGSMVGGAVWRSRAGRRPAAARAPSRRASPRSRLAGDVEDLVVVVEQVDLVGVDVPVADAGHLRQRGSRWQSRSRGARAGRRTGRSRRPGRGARARSV